MAMFRERNVIKICGSNIVQRWLYGKYGYKNKSVTRIYIYVYIPNQKALYDPLNFIENIL